MGSSVNGTFMQERKFLGYHPSDRFSDHSLIFMEDKRILAVLPAAVVQQEDKRILVSHPGASHGGLIIKPSLSTKKCLELVSALVEYCAMTGFDYIRLKPVPKVYHKELSDQLDFALRFSGFKLEYTELATVLELKKGEESFVKRVMSDTAFRNYQKALKSGLSVVEDADINDFWPILENKLKHNHNAKPAHTLDEIKHLKTLYPDRIKLFAAYEGITPCSGCFGIFTERKSYKLFLYCPPRWFPAHAALKPYFWSYDGVGTQKRLFIFGLGYFH